MRKMIMLKFTIYIFILKILCFPPMLRSREERYYLCISFCITVSLLNGALKKQLYLLLV